MASCGPVEKTKRYQMKAKLVMFKADGKRKDFLLQKSVTVIGRGEECDFQVPLLDVSRRHCELTVDGDRIRVKDLASSNGTYVNNKRVNESELRAGDRLAIGPVIFTLQVDGVPGEIEPVKTRGQTLADGGPTTAEAVTRGQEQSAPLADAVADTDAKMEELVVEIKPVKQPKAENEKPGAPVDDPIAALEALAAQSKKKK